MARPLAKRKTGRKARHSGVVVSGDTFLLQASVLVCGAAACGWALLQVILYGASEPWMVAIPLVYPLATFAAVAYERKRLDSWTPFPPPKKNTDNRERDQENDNILTTVFYKEVKMLRGFLKYTSSFLRS